MVSLRFLAAGPSPSPESLTFTASSRALYSFHKVVEDPNRTPGAVHSPAISPPQEMPTPLLHRALPLVTAPPPLGCSIPWGPLVTTLSPAFCKPSTAVPYVPPFPMLLLAPSKLAALKRQDFPL